MRTERAGIAQQDETGGGGGPEQVPPRSIPGNASSKTVAAGWVREVPARCAHLLEKQKALTVVVPIQSDSKQFFRLARALRRIDRNFERRTDKGPASGRGPTIDFAQLKSVHFLRWAILPGIEEGQRKAPPKLVLEANFDGTVARFLDELLQQAGKVLTADIYSRCEPPIPEDGSRAELATYLLEHTLDEALFYQAYPELDLGLIQRNSRQSRAIRELVSEPQRTGLHSLRRTLATLSPVQREGAVAGLQADFLGLVRNQLTLGPEEDFPAPQPRPGRRRLWKAFLGEPVFALAVAALMGLEVLEGLVGSPKTSGTSAREEARARKLARLLQQEDTKVQNQLTLVNDVKRPYFLRLPLLRLVLWAWTREAKYRFNQGSLGGIEGIHFARWVLLEEPLQDGPRDGGMWRGLLRSRKRYRLLFLSNYDGSWEGYLGSFVDRASIGLTTIWCNTRGFPRSRFRWRFPKLFELGAEREEVFKQWVRKYQLRTQTWYSAHEDRSVANIFNDREVCSGPTPSNGFTRWVRCLM